MAVYRLQAILEGENNASADIRQLSTDVKALGRDLDALGRKSPKATVTVTTQGATEAKRDTSEISASVDKLDKKKATIPVEVQSGGAKRSLAEIDSEVQKTFRDKKILQTDADVVGSMAKLERLDNAGDVFDKKTYSAKADVDTSAGDRRVDALGERLLKFQDLHASATANVNTREGARELQYLRGGLLDFDNQIFRAMATVDTRNMPALKEMRSELDTLAGTTATALARVNAGPGRRTLTALTGALKRFGGSTYTANAHVNARGGIASLARLRGGMNNIERRPIRTVVDERAAAVVPRLAGDVLALFARIKTLQAFFGALKVPAIAGAFGVAIPVVAGLILQTFTLASALGTTLVGSAAAATGAFGVMGLALGTAGFLMVRAAKNAGELNAKTARGRALQRGFNKSLNQTKTAMGEMADEASIRLLPSMTNFLNVSRRGIPFLGKQMNRLADNTNRAVIKFTDLASSSKQTSIYRFILRNIANEADRVVRIAGNVGLVLINTFGAAIPAGRLLLGFLDRLFGRWQKFTSSTEGQNQMRRYFLDSARFAGRFLTAIGRLIKGLYNVGVAMNLSGATDNLLRGLEKGARAFERTTAAGGRGRKMLIQFSRGIRPAMRQLGGLIGDVVFETMRLAMVLGTARRAGSKYTVLETIFRNLRKAVRPLGDALATMFITLGPELSRFAKNMARLAPVAAENAYLLEGMLKIVNRLLEAFLRLPPGAQQAILMMVTMGGVISALIGGSGGFGIIGAVVAWARYRKILRAIGGAHGGAVKSAGPLRRFINWIGRGLAAAGKAVGRYASAFVRAGGPLRRFLGWLGRGAQGVGRFIRSFANMRSLTRFVSFLGRLGGHLIRFVPWIVRFGVAFLGLSNPVGWAVLAITGLVTIFLIAYKRSDRFRAIVNQVAGAIGRFAKAVGRIALRWLVKEFQQTADGARKVGRWIGTAARAFARFSVRAFRAALRGAQAAIRAIGRGLSSFGRWVGNAARATGRFSMRAFNAAVRAGGAALRFIGRLLSSFGRWVGNAARAVGRFSLRAFNTALRIGGNLIKGFINILRGIGRIAGRVGGWFADMGGKARKATGNIAKWFQGLPQKIGNALKSLPGKVAGAFRRASTGASKWLGNMADAARDKAGDARKWVTTRTSQAAENGIKNVRRLYNGAKGRFEATAQSANEKFGDVRKWVTTRTSQAAENGMKHARRLYNGARSRFDATAQSANEKFGDVRKWVTTRTSQAAENGGKNARKLYNSAKSRFQETAESANNKFSDVRKWITTRTDQAKTNATENTRRMGSNLLDSWTNQDKESNKRFENIRGWISNKTDNAAEKATKHTRRMGTNLFESWGNQDKESNKRFDNIRKWINTRTDQAAKFASKNTKRMGGNLFDSWKNQDDESDNRFTSIRKTISKRTDEAAKNATDNIRRLGSNLIDAFRNQNKNAEGYGERFRSIISGAYKKAINAARSFLGGLVKAAGRVLGFFGADSLASDAKGLAADLNSPIAAKTGGIVKGRKKLQGFAGGGVAPTGGSAHPFQYFEMGGMSAVKQGPFGGIADGVTPRVVYGEGEGGQEAYIREKRPASEQMPFLQTAASWHKARVVPDPGARPSPTMNMFSGHDSPAREREDEWAARTRNDIACFARGGLGVSSVPRPVPSYPISNYSMYPNAGKMGQTVANQFGVPATTYPGHDRQSNTAAAAVDWLVSGQWGRSGGAEKASAILKHLFANWSNYGMSYVISQGRFIDRPNSSGRSWNRPSVTGSHRDHTHGNVNPNGKPSYGFSGGSGTGGASMFDVIGYVKGIMDKYMKPPDVGAGALGQGFIQGGGMIAEKAVDFLVSQGEKLMGSIGGLLSGSAGTIGEALEKGGWPKDKQVEASSVVWSESTGNAKAQNPSGARGLMQIMPATARGVGASYDKLYDPVYNTSAGLKVFRQAGSSWRPWVGSHTRGDFRNKPVTNAPKMSGAEPPDRKKDPKGGLMGGSTLGGFNRGGIALKPQIAQLAERGPEMVMPLDNPQSAQRFIRHLTSLNPRRFGDPVREHRRAQERPETVNRERREPARSGARRESDERLEAALERLGNRLDERLSDGINANLTNVAEMIEMALAAQDSPAGRKIQSQNRAKAMREMRQRKGDS